MNADAAVPLGRPRAAVRQTLRAATDHVHERLHLAEPFEAIGRGNIAPARYADLLCRLLRFHDASNAALQRGHALLRAVPYHDRAPLLRADLQSLGITCQPRPSPQLAALPDDETVGVVYAVEGSLLGGRVIDRQLDAVFGGRTEGRTFFASEVGPDGRWQRVCAALERHGADPGRVPAMCRGALRSFIFMEHCLGNDA